MAIEHFLSLPNRKQNPETLSEDTNNLFKHLPTFIDQTNSAIDLVNQSVIDCAASVSSAATSATSAGESAATAASYSGLSNYKGQWAAGSYGLGETVYHNSAFWISGVAANAGEPGVSANWQPVHQAGMVGNLSSPLLDLPLKNSLTMRSGAGAVTYTCASTSTYIDRYGVLQYAAINEPRFEKEGLLIEGVSTNMLLNSEDLTAATYTKTESTITANAINAPDGNLTADKVVCTTANAYHGFYFSPTNMSQDRTVSFFAKAGEFSKFRTRSNNGGISTCSATFDLANGVVEAGDAKIEALADGWYRCSVLEVKVTNNPHNIIIDMFNNSGSVQYAGDGVSGMYFWGGQYEALPFVTSYIPTSGTQATRANNSCSIGNVTGNMSPDKTICADFLLLGSNGVNGQYILDVRDLGGSGHGTLLLARDPSGAILYQQNDADGTRAIQQAIADYGVAYRAIVTQGINSAKAYLNGVLVATNEALKPTYSEGSTIELGSYNYGGTNNSHLFGHLANVKFYDKEFTATEARLA